MDVCPDSEASKESGIEQSNSGTYELNWAVHPPLDV